MRSESNSAIAPDTRGQNFYTSDKTLINLASLYLSSDLLAGLSQQLEELGFRAANDLDEHAALANRHVPVIHHRDKYGQDHEWIEYHPSYRALEEAAFGDYAMHAMSHRPTLKGWGKPLPIVAKHLHTFLFNQAEFGLGCPINVTDSAIHLIEAFGDEIVKAKLLPRMLTSDTSQLWQGAQFITEQEGGSDVGQVQTTAQMVNGQWQLTGDKWFCSNADAEVAMILARPEGAQAGTRGLALYAMPRTLEDGSPNRIQIVRLKDKLGTRSMASGELRFNGAFAYLIGNQNRGFNQMAEMINWSRLSNGVKSSALMRRAVHDALTVSKNRQVFGSNLIDLALGKRQLLKLLLPSEQSMSIWMWTANLLDSIGTGQPASNDAAQIVRLATPVLKFRSTRDARTVCGDSMEVRGGCGYVEDFVNPRLVRDAYLGSIWEGTSNIVAIDAVRRAIGRSNCLPSYLGALEDLLDSCEVDIPDLVSELRELLESTKQLIEFVIEADDEANFRLVTSTLYRLTSAVLMAWEGVQLNSRTGDASRLLWAGLVIDHKLRSNSSFALPASRPELEDKLLNVESVSLSEAIQLIT